jgi:hypothetical protein
MLIWRKVLAPSARHASAIISGSMDFGLERPEKRGRAPGASPLSEAIWAENGVPRTRLLAFERSDGRHYYNVSAVPIRDAAGNVTAALTAAVHVKASA